MSSALYNRDILRLAASIPHHGRLERADASADRRSPTCGSRVIAEVTLDETGRIAELGIDVRACALGQASASLMAAKAIGKSPDEMAAAAAALRAYLANPKAPATADFWPGMDIFAAARSYPARHPSILLGFETVAEAASLALSAHEREIRDMGA